MGIRGVGLKLTPHLRGAMRKRKEIEQDQTRLEILQLEILLDIRELLMPEKPKRKYTKRKGSVKCENN